MNSKFVAAMPAVARELLGAENKSLSSPTELRFGSKGSLSIHLANGTWFDHEADQGGGVVELVQRERGGTRRDAISWLETHGHLEPATRAASRKTVQYVYRDADGAALRRVCRQQEDGKPKRIWQQHLADGRWVNGDGDAPDVPYRLPELLAASESEPVLIVEGEKCADRLASWNVIATCNRGGATAPKVGRDYRGKWQPGISLHFAGRNIIILPDNDDTGRAHANDVARNLHGIAASVRLLELPGLPAKGDIIDWIEAGGTAEQFAALVAEVQDAPAWLPDQASPIDGGASDETAEPRSFDEMMAEAATLTATDTDAIETLVAEANTLSEVKRDQVFRAIKAAAGIGLTILRAQSRSDAPAELDHLDLARVTLDKIGRENIVCAEAFVWTWQEKGVWQAQDDRAIKQAVQGSIDAALVDVQASTVSGVTEVLKNEIFKPNHVFNRGNPEAVNCPNGELELEAGQWVVKPHDRENYRTTQIPVPYDLAADAPRFRQFLGEVFRDDDDRDDKVKSLLELIGYTLMSHANHEKFVMLIGPGANGKSVLLAVLEALCGVENVAGVQPSNFDRSFQRAHLHMKLANIVTELKQGEVIADAELKAITSGEPATVEHKFGHPFVMRPYATCWFGTNHMPHTRDFSEALFRRATILQFNRTFSREEQDPNLKGKLFAELPGILVMALNTYASALARGFTQPASSEHCKSEWRLEADQIAQFVDEACARLDGGRVQSSTLFNAYRGWAERNGIRQIFSQKGLRGRLDRLGFGAERNMAGRYVTGLVLNDST